MRYSEDIIEKVREASDIVDVVGSYVALKKKGGTYFGLCPFHNEKTASFSVSQGKQMFYCFGCHEGGSVFSFVMKYENMSYTEAIKHLADRAGIALPEVSLTKDQKLEMELKAQIMAANNDAGKYFFSNLISDKGRKALEYFKNRGLSEGTIKKYGLGYSLVQKDDLYLHLKGLGYSDEIITAAGLASIKENGAFDAFWNRAMFPIINGQGKVIGFGGRVLGDGEPKYLNTKETKAFDKRKNLFGINVARTSRRPYVILCEGYMDVISLHQAGFTCAMASLGTALTYEQATLIKRFANTVYLSYDSDSAGRKAALRATSILRNAGLIIKVINLAPYKDPDELIKATSAEEYEKRIDDAISAFMFEVSMLSENYKLDDPQELTIFINELIKMLVCFEDELERDNYMKAISANYGISYELLSDKLKKFAVSNEGLKVLSEKAKEEEDFEIARPVEKQFEKKENAQAKSEKLLLTWLVEEKEAFDKVKKYITPEDFTEGFLRDVATKLFAQLEEGKCDPARIIDSYEDEAEHSQVALVFNSSLDNLIEDKEKSKALADTVKKILTASIDRQIREETDLLKVSALMKRKQELVSIRI